MAKKHKNSSNEIILKNILFGVSLLALISISGMIYYYQKYTTTADELSMIQTGFTTKLWQPGEAVETPDFVITINNVDIDRQGIPQYLPIPEGMQFITLDMDVKNKTSNDILFLPINSTYLKDQDGNIYGLTTTAKVEQEIAGTVVAGDTKTGQVGFMVPQNTSALRFYFEPYGQEDGNTIVIDLNSYL